MQLLFPFGKSGAQRRREAFAIRKTIHNNIDIKKIYGQIYLDKTRKILKDVI